MGLFSQAARPSSPQPLHWMARPTSPPACPCRNITSARVCVCADPMPIPEARSPSCRHKPEPGMNRAGPKETALTWRHTPRVRASANRGNADKPETVMPRGRDRHRRQRGFYLPLACSAAIGLGASRRSSPEISSERCGRRTGDLGFCVGGAGKTGLVMADSGSPENPQTGPPFPAPQGRAYKAGPRAKEAATARRRDKRKARRRPIAPYGLIRLPPTTPRFTRVLSGTMPL